MTEPTPASASAIPERLPSGLDTDGSRHSSVSGAGRSASRFPSQRRGGRDDAPPGRDGASTAASGASKAASILVVDESPGVLRMVEKLLGHNGYSTRSANSSEEALSVLEQDGDDIDVLLIDVSTARPLNREVVDRARASRPTLKILCMAASARDLGDEPAVLPLLRKPFGSAELNGALEELLSP